MATSRVRSLDLFRGLTVALMILVNNPGTWDHVFPPLRHAEWHGLTPTDLVFPFFLFAVGNAMAFVRLTPPKILKRTALIFGIGLALNWAPFLIRIDGGLLPKTWTWVNAQGELVGIRVLGVLQRIALAYGIAALWVCRFPRRALEGAGIALGLSVVLALAFGHGDPWSLEGFFGTPVDRALLGPEHLYHGEGVAFDPEGLLSTIAPVAQVLIGYWVGLRFRPGVTATALRPILGSAAALLAIGYAGSLYQPINKKIWTATYTLVTSGYAIALLAAVEAACRARGPRVERAVSAVAPFFEVFGRNPLFIYVLSGLIPRVLSLFPATGYYERVCARFPGPPECGSLVYALSLVAFYWAVGAALDRKKIYVRV